MLFLQQPKLESKCHSEGKNPSFWTITKAPKAQTEFIQMTLHYWNHGHNNPMKRLENRAENHEKKHMEKGNQLRLVPNLEVVNLSICFYFKNFEGLFTL